MMVDMSPFRPSIATTKWHRPCAVENPGLITTIRWQPSLPGRREPSPASQIS